MMRREVGWAVLYVTLGLGIAAYAPDDRAPVLLGEIDEWRALGFGSACYGGFVAARVVWRLLVGGGR